MFLEGIVPYICWLKDMCVSARVCVCVMYCAIILAYMAAIFL